MASRGGPGSAPAAATERENRSGQLLLGQEPRDGMGKDATALGPQHYGRGGTNTMTGHRKGSDELTTWGGDRQPQLAGSASGAGGSRQPPRRSLGPGGGSGANVPGSDARQAPSAPKTGRAAAGRQQPPASATTQERGMDDVSLRQSNREAVKKYRRRKKEEESNLLDSVNEVRGQVRDLEELIELIRQTQSEQFTATTRAALMERRELRQLRDLKQRMVRAFSLNEDQESAC